MILTAEWHAEHLFDGRNTQLQELWNLITHTQSILIDFLGKKHKKRISEHKNNFKKPERSILAVSKTFKQAMIAIAKYMHFNAVTKHFSCVIF